MTEQDQPLSGVRVLDIATFIAGPFCGTILGDFGAEVLKVEHPKDGDPMRKPFARGMATLHTRRWINFRRFLRSILLISA